MKLGDNPWKILDKKVMYENPWIRVCHHDVLNPKGGKGIYGTVEFANLAIGIVPVDSNLNTWLVGQYRFPIEAYSWEIPEGGCPLNEDYLQAAKRELREETGLTASSWQEISTVHTSNSVCRETGYIFLAEGITEGVAMPEDTEQLVIKKLPLADALKMVWECQITDSLSVIGLMKVAKLKGIL